MVKELSKISSVSFASFHTVSERNVQQDGGRLEVRLRRSITICTNYYPAVLRMKKRVALHANPEAHHHSLHCKDDAITWYCLSAATPAGFPPRFASVIEIPLHKRYIQTRAKQSFLNTFAASLSTRKAVGPDNTEPCM